VASDDGVGIPEGIQQRIFDPFFTTRDVGEGVGQGLAVAHSVIVDRHGGQISLETALGMGATFIVRLPLPKASDAFGDPPSVRAS
jgi:signal transduction histidine kinase